MIIIYLFTIIGLLSTPFFIYDAYLIIRSMYCRYHIGRWPNRKVWQAAVEKKCIEWFYKPPSVPISDEKRFILWDIIRHKHSNSTIKSWQFAGILLGLENKYSTIFLKRHNPILSNDIDNALLIYVLWKKHALDDIDLKKYTKILLGEKKETIPYRKRLPNIRFVDTIGMVLPLLVAGGQQERAMLQLKEFEPALLNGIFPAHAYDLERGLPLGIYDWGRGLGWYILGVTEANIDSSLDSLIVRTADNLLSLQKSNGGLSCKYFTESHLESSGTAMLGILFINAFKITHNIIYYTAALKAEKCLMSITRRNGEIDFAQGDTKGIGSYSNIFDIMPFTQGMTLYLSHEIDKYSTCAH